MGLIPGPLSHPEIRFKARLLRCVTKRDKTGRAKVAKDTRLDVKMERVKARETRECAKGRACGAANNYINMAGYGYILGGTEYAKVYANEGQGKMIKGRMVYSPRDYHFECVPEAYRPLVRFLR